jgi:hypothetical protein
MAPDIHIPETALRRPVVLSFSVDPKGFSVFAVQAAPAHIRLLKELMTAPINTPIMNARL